MGMHRNALVTPAEIQNERNTFQKDPAGSIDETILIASDPTTYTYCRAG